MTITVMNIGGLCSWWCKYQLLNLDIHDSKLETRAHVVIIILDLILRKERVIC